MSTSNATVASDKFGIYFTGIPREKAPAVSYKLREYYIAHLEEHLFKPLAILGWTNETALTLRDKLNKKNCHWIATTVASGNVILIYPNQVGWGTYSYSVHEKPIIDSLVSINGSYLNKECFYEKYCSY